MGEHELVPCQPRPFRITTEPGADAGVPDLLQRDFTADRYRYFEKSVYKHLRSRAGGRAIDTPVSLFGLIS